MQNICRQKIFPGVIFRTDILRLKISEKHLLIPEFLAILLCIGSRNYGRRFIFSKAATSLRRFILPALFYKRRVMRMYEKLALELTALAFCFSVSVLYGKLKLSVTRCVRKNRRLLPIDDGRNKITS